MFIAANASATLMLNPWAINKEKHISESNGGTTIDEKYVKNPKKNRL